MRISIFSLFRDSEDSIHNCLGNLEKIEQQTDASFKYFFYENDSTDQTVDILSQWMENRHGKFLSEKLNAPKFGSTLQKERMLLLSDVRNKMAALDQTKDSEFSVIFDSDVNFKPHIINDFLKLKDLTFSMLTSNIRQDIPCKMGSGSKDSYYDSSILYDKYGIQCMTWSDNPFYDTADRDLYEQSKPIQVNRAFGSFAFLKTEYFSRCSWSSKGESEHLSFCDKLNQLAPIYFIPSIRPTVHIEQKKWDHEDRVITHQKHLLENKWNRFLWKNKIQSL